MLHLVHNTRSDSEYRPAATLKATRPHVGCIQPSFTLQRTVAAPEPFTHHKEPSCIAFENASGRAAKSAFAMAATSEVRASKRSGARVSSSRTATKTKQNKTKDVNRTCRCATKHMRQMGSLKKKTFHWHACTSATSIAISATNRETNTFQNIIVACALGYKIGVFWLRSCVPQRHYAQPFATTNNMRVGDNEMSYQYVMHTQPSFGFETYRDTVFNTESHRIHRIPHRGRTV